MFSMQLTGEQIRAARALGRVEQSELAKLAGISLETVKRLERIRGVVDANFSTIKAIIAAFQLLGIAFAAGGVTVTTALADQVLPAPAAPAKEQVRDPIFRIIYCSAAVEANEHRYWAAINTLTQLTQMADITGYMFLCDNTFLHLLEGPKTVVRQFYAAIASDPRHSDLKIIQAAEVAARLFDTWTGHDEILSHSDPVFDDQATMAGGFVHFGLTAAAAVGLLSAVRDEHWARTNGPLRVMKLA
jgi:transcriptional regulator with XRE-family HTH domain